MNTLAFRVAEQLLRRDGAGVIWQAHQAAARLEREGNRRAAEILLAIADAAAEQAVRRAAPSDWVPGRWGGCRTPGGSKKPAPLNNKGTRHSERQGKV